MNKKSTQGSRGKNFKATDMTYSRMIQNSLVDLFHPNSSSKLINYRDLNLINWSDLNLINMKDLNLVDVKSFNLLNLSAISLFIQYVGAFTFVFTLVFALPFRLLAETSLIDRSNEVSYAHTMELAQLLDNRDIKLSLNNEVVNGAVPATGAVLGDSSVNVELTKSETAKLESTGLVKVDLDKAQNEVVFSGYTLKEVKRKSNWIALGDDSKIGNVLGVKTVNEVEKNNNNNNEVIYIDAKDIFVEEDAVEVEATAEGAEITVNNEVPVKAESIAVTEVEKEVESGDQISLISAIDTLPRVEALSKLNKVGLRAMKPADAKSFVLGASDENVQFERAGSCSFKNDSDFYSSGSTINIDEVSGLICFKLDSAKDSDYEVGFTNLKGQTIVLQSKSGCVDSAKLAGLNGELEISFSDTYHSQCSLVLASL